MKQCSPLFFLLICKCEKQFKHVFFLKGTWSQDTMFDIRVCKFNFAHPNGLLRNLNFSNTKFPRIETFMTAKYFCSLGTVYNKTILLSSLHFCTNFVVSITNIINYNCLFSCSFWEFYQIDNVTLVKRKYLKGQCQEMDIFLKV